MSNISVFGKGNMGKAIASNFEDAGNTVSFVAENDQVATLGDIVVFAVPYPAVAGIIEKYRAELAGNKIIGN
ncbi:putative dinucleotide-binding enzyme [Weissella beninensis]|uniref:6-phosphogluconate dehydrogenase NADP-binding domain-containing protein n=1 Tax=Periweissella beninensis TaxID=504936 RepID=A0ABT0VHN8_9LACO|nr:hypothetical protein [Periweissella beninensis]MBM7543378.1 putative dinucleotide-binding enzyme [Periweissella beninensis]MCM2437325.1 hypothetical protein [Periweissella beninensis]